MSDGEQNWYVLGYVVGGLLWGVLATIYRIDVWQVVVCVPVGAVVAKVWYWWRRRRELARMWNEPLEGSGLR